MKRMKQCVCGLVMVALVSNVLAREDTGKILNRLVEKVDNKLTALEDSLADQAKEREGLQIKLKKEAERFNTSENEIDKNEAKAEVIALMSELNVTDWTQVNATLGTIVSVITDLDQLNKAISEGELSPEKLDEQRRRLRNVLTGVGPIMKALNNLEDKKAQAYLKTTRQTMILLYKQLSLPINGSSGVIGQLGKTIDTLQDVACQLRMVKEVLDIEKMTLTLAAHNQLAEMALLRLAGSRLGDHQIGDVAIKLHDQVVVRITDYSDILNSSAIGSIEGDELAETDEDIWSNIENGRIPEVK